MNIIAVVTNKRIVVAVDTTTGGSIEGNIVSEKVLF